MVTIICYTSKTLSNGEHPIMIRWIENRKVRYKSLGISILAKYWDFKRNRPKRNCPNREYVLEKILRAELKYACGRGRKSVGEFFEEYIEELIGKGKIGNAKVYKDGYDFLLLFTNGKLDIPFSAIDTLFLEGYVQWMRGRDWKGTTISLQLRTLRSLYNKAITRKWAKRKQYPFREFKISSIGVKTEKRAISKEEMKEIMELELEGFKLNFSRDIFVFSYLCGGINFIDIAHLKGTQLVGNCLTYVRKKTGVGVVLSISQRALEIVEYYRPMATDNYLFPILNDTIHITPKQIFERRKKVLKGVNKGLKVIAQIAGIEANLTTYVARHTFATVLKNSGVSVAMVKELLGHANIETTQIYLDSFDTKQVKKALEYLL